MSAKYIKRTENFRPRCSGWGVFPDGKKCKGCEDCKGEQFGNKNPIETHVVTKRVKK